MTLRTISRSIISTLIVGIMFMLLAVVFLTTLLRTSADYAAKASQAPYKPGRQLYGGSSSAPAPAELRGNGNQAMRSARLPYEAGRKAGEWTGNTTAPEK